MQSIYNLVLMSLVTAMFFSCATNKTEFNTENTQETKKNPISSLSLTPISLSGNNKQAFFLNENEISFISYQRKSHKKGQLYTYNLETKNEKRVTFQQGEVNNAGIISSSQDLIYTSNTDETRSLAQIVSQFVPNTQESNIKEDVQFTFIPSGLAPQEIYTINTQGDNINRLTHNPGFDGMVSFHEKKKNLFFSRQTESSIQIFKLNIEKPEIALQLTKNKYQNISPDVNLKNETLAWIEFNPENNISKINLADLNFKKIKSVYETENNLISVKWHPDGKWLVFSSKNKNDNLGFDIFALKSDGSCLTGVVNSEGNDYQPSFSPQGQNMIFTSTQREGEQLYLMPFSEPTCPQDQKNTAYN